jgi:hypothetical protein
MAKSDSLIESKSLRESVIRHTEVLDKVKHLSLLPDDINASVELVADYFEVGKAAITSLIFDNRDEIESNGLKVLSGDELISLKELGVIGKNASAFTIIPRPAILNIGMLLRDSLVARGVRNYLLDVESNSRNDQPKSIEDLIIMQAQSVKELKSEVRQMKVDQQNIKSDTVRLNHRIENIDSANIDGDKQQRLNKMMRRLAWQEGTPYQSSWKLFDQAFNNAFHTNLTAKRNNYAERHGKKNVTRPEYLSATGQIDDALRIADKILNKKEGVS